MATDLNIQVMALCDLEPAPYNPREISATALAGLRNSVERFGLVEPVVWNRRTGRVVGGHQRLKVLQGMGETETQVVVVDLDDTEEKALNVALNNPAIAGSFTADLHKLLAEINESMPELADLLRFDDLAEQTRALLADLTPNEGATDPDEVPEAPEIPITQPGDLWVLGRHRLVCGDSGEPAILERLMDGQKAQLYATDPPYGVGYDGTAHPQNARDKDRGRQPGSQNRDWSGDYHDHDAWDHFADREQFEGFLERVFLSAKGHVDLDAAWYCWHASATAASFLRAWEITGIRYHQTITWVKPTHVLGFAMWNYRTEPCLMGWQQGHKPAALPVPDEHSNCWEVDWEGKARCTDGQHPCLHPDAHVLTEAGYRPIRSLKVGDQVYADDGAFHRVSAVSCHPYGSPDLVRIVAKGGNTPTLSSDNHPFLIWRPTRRGRRVTGGEVSWLRADQMEVGDYTMTPVMSEPELDPFPEKDEEYWFLFGLYLAQGSIQKAGHGKNRYPVFSLHKKRQDIIGRIANHWESTSEYDSNDYGRLSQGVTVMAFDPASGAEFAELGGSLAHAKRIASAVLRLPRAKRLAVLQGWLNGDGCRVHNRSYWQGKTASSDLAAHLALLGASVGYKTNVFRYDPPDHLGTILGRQIQSQRPEYHLYFYDLGQMDRRARCAQMEHEGRQYILRYVKSVERVPYVGDVWNLSVEGSPTFQTAVGMSHNTQKPVRLFELPMLKHTRPGAICLETFAGSGSQVIAAERLDRRCFAVERMPQFCDVVVKRWEQYTGQTAIRVPAQEVE